MYGIHVSANLLELHLLNRVPEAQLDALDEHLMVCHSCLDRAEQAQSELSLLVQTCAQFEVARRKGGRLRAITRAIQFKSYVTIARQPVSLWMTVAAAGVLIASIGFISGVQKRNPEVRGSMTTI